MRVVSVGIKLLKANLSRLVVLAAGSVAIALAAAAIAVAASTSLATVHETIAAGWRGPYDLLVRPREADTFDLNGESLVPMDYLGSRTQGITREEWKSIEGIPGVDVAAPVAALGWLKQDDVAVNVHVPRPTAGEILRVDVEVVFEGDVTSHRTGFIALDRDGAPQLTVGIDNVAVVEDLQLSLSFLPSAWGEVVGIDPTAENALVGLQRFVDGELLESGVRTTTDQAFGTQAISIPVITAAHASIPGTASVRVSRLTTEDAPAIARAVGQLPGSGSTAEILKAQVALVERMTGGADAVGIAEDSAPLADLLQPFRTTPVTLLDGHLTADASTGGLTAAYGRNVLLVPTPKSYVRVGNGLTLKPHGTWATAVQPRIDAAQPDGFTQLDVSFGPDDPVYRPLDVQVPPPFVVEPVGTYDLEAIASHFAGTANYAPLGIYVDQPRRLLSDASGATVDQDLPTSMNPGGLNPLPPIGLTNLETVEALRGARFIDAIRVRVEGIDGYDHGGIAEIERIAGAIIQRTGLHVDVVAGSSPVNLPVTVPGVGIIAEPWTTLGIAPQIESAAEGASGLLLWLSVVVVIMYLLAFAVFITEDQSREIATLRRVGWRKRSVVLMVATQAALIGATTALISALLAALYVGLAGLRITGTAYVGIATIIVAGHLIAAVSVVLWALHRPLEGQRGAIAQPQQSRPRRGLLGLARDNLIESRFRGVLAAVALAFALASAGAVVAIELGFGGTLRQTIFGEVVALRVGSYHALAAAAALFAAAAMSLDAGLLVVERRVGLIGLLRAVGWDIRAVQRLISIEVATPAFAAGAIAGVSVLVISLAVGLTILVALLLMAITTLIGSGIGLLVARPLASVAAGVSPIVALHAEGATGAVPGLAPRTMLLTVGTIVAFLAVGGIGSAIVPPAAIPASAFLARPTSAPPSATALRLRADIKAIAAAVSRRPGSASMLQAQAYVRAQLRLSGFEIDVRPFLVRAPEFLDVAGSPMDATSIHTIALAYAPDAVDANSPWSVALIGADSQPSEDACVQGVVVIRVRDEGEAGLAGDYVKACGSDGTSAALTVLADDERGWARLVGDAKAIQLPVAAQIVASTATVSATTPWLVAALDSTGAGASQSAASAAVLLELARQAAESGIPARMAFVAASDGSALSTLLKAVALETPGAPIIELGAMGGSLTPVLGTSGPPPDVDVSSARAGLVSTLVVDGEFDDWIARIKAPTGRTTSEPLLAQLGEATGLVPAPEGGFGLFGLAIGMDVAYLGEPLDPIGGVSSIAGTESDTPDQVDVAALSRVVDGLNTFLSTADR